MPGKYDADKRLITLETSLEEDTPLAIATLVNNVVRDLLHQKQFSFIQSQEAVDVAVIATGLGVLQSGISMVNDGGKFWDPTGWEVHASPFLGAELTAYAHAVAAWTRGGSSDWVVDLPANVASGMKKSLKYLNKTKDCFVARGGELAKRYEKEDWIRIANEGGMSTRIIALRHLDADEEQQAKLDSAVDNGLRSGHRDLILHCTNAAIAIRSADEGVATELRTLAQNSDDHIRSKAVFALGQLGLLDESTVGVAGRMLESKRDFVTYTALTALASLDAAPESVVQNADRGLKRTLQSCNYQFVGLFAVVYQRWLDDPAGHFETLLAEDSPEYLQIALEALEEVKKQFVELGQSS